MSEYNPEPDAPHVFKTGDALRIEYGGRIVEGRVKLASPNGVSLMLEYEALLGGYAGQMPVLYSHTKKGFFDILVREPVTLTPLD